MIKGPNGICDVIFLDLLIKAGTTDINAMVEDKKMTNGTDCSPNQKPITAKSLASPKPMPSFFLTCL